MTLSAAFEDTGLKLELAYSAAPVPAPPMLSLGEDSALQRAWRLKDGHIDKVCATASHDVQRLKLVFEA